MRALLLLAGFLGAISAPGLAQSRNDSGMEPSGQFRTTQEQIEHDLPTQAPASRKTLARFAGCVADHDGLKVKALLLQDYTQKGFHASLDRLFRSNRDCVNQAEHRSIGSGELSFSAALAEHLLKRDPIPLNVRLAKAASGKPVEAYGPTNAAALCAARSAPDDVGRLFATEPDSEAETAAASALSPVLSACARSVGSRPISATPFGMRSILATAAFRLLAAQES